MGTVIHHVVSYVFSEPFRLSQISARQDQAQPSSVGPKATLTRIFPEGGRMFFHSFGAITFWNVSSKQIGTELQKAAADLGVTSSETAASEVFNVHESIDSKPKAEFNHFIVDILTKERAEVIAMTVAQSVTMEYYEKLADGIWSKVSNYISDLRRRGNVGPSPLKLHPVIAEAISIRSSVVGVMHLLDRPDLIWTDKEMDAVYSDLRSSFDLNERFQAMEYKINLLQDSLELLIEMARDRRLFWLEAAIVLLILIDIVINLF